MGLLLQARQHDGLELAVQLGAEAPRRRGRLAEDLRDDVDRARALERRPPREQGVEGGPQPIHVGGRADAVELAGRLLGRHVGGRPERGAGPGQALAVLEARQPEVGHLGAEGRVEQDVRRLEVAVQHTAPVGVLDRLGYALEQRGRLPRRQRALPPQAGLEALPLHEVHGDERRAAVLADLVHPDHVRVLEARHGLGLAPEARQGRGAVLPRPRAQDLLERHPAAELEVLRQVDHPHPAARQLAHHAIGADPSRVPRAAAARRGRRERLLVDGAELTERRGRHVAAEERQQRRRGLRALAGGAVLLLELLALGRGEQAAPRRVRQHRSLRRAPRILPPGDRAHAREPRPEDADPLRRTAPPTLRRSPGGPKITA